MALSGARVGPYVLLRELARGGMGVVYEAQAPDGGRVALKVLAGTTSADAQARFDRERRLLAELSSAHGFVPLLDAGEHRGQPWLVMPFMAGGSLRDRLRRGPLSVEAAVALGHELAVTIGRAHARGIVHRDLKPENVLFERPGDDAPPKIADLGVAKHFRRQGLEAALSANLSRSGAMLGTACYMAPEQVNDARRVEPPADVFALAQIVYECLAGVTPFARDSLQETMVALIDGRPTPLRQQVPAAPPWLDRVLTRALATDPRRRFPDGHAFARALALKERGPGARRRGRPVLALTLGAAGLVALGAVGVVVARRSDAPIVVDPPAPPAPADPPPAVAAAADAELASAQPAAPVEAPVEAPVSDATIDEPGFDATSASAWTARASALLRSRQLDAAVEAFRRAIELAPERKAARVILVSTLLEARRIDEALAEAERLVAMGADPASLYARGAALIAARQLRGLADLERAIEKNPNYSVAWSQLSVGRVRARDWVGARDAAERALSLSAARAHARRSRGLARAALGDPAGARVDLERFRAELHPDDAPLDAELQAGLARVGAPTDPAPDAMAAATRLVEEAWLAKAQGDRAAARGLCERALAAAPDHAGALAMSGAVTGGERGLALLDRAIDLGPVEGWMHVERAKHRHARREFAAAADDYELAMARDGASFDAVLARAHALELAGDLARALSAAKQAIRLEPNRSACWILLARLERKGGRANFAERFASEATTLAPDDPETWRELGQVLLQRSRWSDAIGAFERLLALAPDDTGGLVGRGAALASSGRGAEGLRDLERALAARPDDTDVLVALAACRATTGDVAGARDTADHALRLEPGKFEALRVRALARGDLGDLDGARADLAELLDRAPAAVERDPALQALRRKLQL